MTKQELYTLTTELTSGISIDATLFDQFLDIAQSQIEDIRPWVILRGEDSSQSVGPGTTFTDAKNLATDFKEFYEEDPIKLVTASYNTMTLTEVPYADRFQYRNAGARFCIDYANSKIYLLGTITESYTMHQNYIKLPMLVSAGNVWVFPERFHKILAYMVAIYWRKGIDYDMFNQTLADNQAAVVRGIVDTLTRWDSNLQQNMQRGKYFNSENYAVGGGWSGSTNGGSLQ